MGDVNAKIAKNTLLTKQTERRNRTMLTEVLAQPNTEIVNTREIHTGSWTKVNRKNLNER
jgi:predicted amino acid dehydrogenase